MYTLLDLQSKTFGELRKIGDELNVLPGGDRRLRQTWIDAIAGVNPPLLQLLEVSAAVEAQAQEPPIIETVKTSPGVEVEPVQEASLESKFGRIVYPRPAQEAIATPKFRVGDLVQSKTMLWGIQKESLTGTVLELLPRGGVRVQFGNHISGYGGTFDFSKSQLEDLIPVQEAIEPIDDLVNTSQRQEAIEPIDDLVNTSQRQKAIEPAPKTSPGVEVDRDDVPECSHCFDDGFVEDASGVIKLCHCSESKLSRQKTQSAIVPAAKNHIEDESDLNPILTGMALSDRFLARYSPPQPEIEFNVGTDGQLSLLDFSVADEPPDPDDFESLDAFREAIARWDAQNPEPPAVSLDSICEWAPCPEEWYEPKAENLPLKASSMIELPEKSEVTELLRAGESFVASDFSIPTFGAWCDRTNRDEPPDTRGIFARLPKPKPPSFPPPQASQPKSAQVSPSQQGIPKLSRNYPETIPKPFHRVAAGTSTQPARSPPGGDAV